MALRHRDIVSTVADRENLHSKPGKALISKPAPLTRRPALDELSNKLNAPKPPLKKQDTLKDLKPILKPSVKAKKENEPPKSYSSAQLDTIVDHEVEVSDDPQMVSEYLDDIYKYLRELELKYPIKEKFLEGHRSTPRMRAILVNWLVQVHQNFSLCLETLHLCVSLVDRYLQEKPEVGRESLQLVGTSALLIACKYEEMYLPKLSDFEYICDNTFSEREILKMEMGILVALDCTLGKPLSIHFLRRYSKLANVRPEHHNLSKYLLELALLDYSMCHIKPSLQAAAACCLSLAILSNATCASKVWTARLAQYTNCKYSCLKHVVVRFAVLLLDADTSKNKSIYQKYGEAKFGKISSHPKLRGNLVKRLAESSPKA